MAASKLSYNRLNPHASPINERARAHRPSRLPIDTLCAHHQRWHALVHPSTSGVESRTTAGGPRGARGGHERRATDVRRFLSSVLVRGTFALLCTWGAPIYTNAARCAPHSNAGGGGERVLWTAVKHLQETDSAVVCVVYTGDVDATKQDIITRVNVRGRFSRVCLRALRALPLQVAVQHQVGRVVAAFRVPRVARVG